MSSTSGWIEYEGGRIDLPFIPRHHGVWDMTIAEWCKENRVHFDYVDPSWVSAPVTKDQIEDFVEFAYCTSAPKDRYEEVSMSIVKERHSEVEKLQAAIAGKLPADGKFLLSGFDY